MKMKISHKIALLPLFCLVSACLIGWVIQTFQAGIADTTEGVDTMNDTSQIVFEARVAEKSYIQLYNLAFAKRLRERCDTALSKIKTIGDMPGNEKYKDHLNKIRNELEGYRLEFDQIVMNHSKSSRMQQEMSSLGNDIVKKIDLSFVKKADEAIMMAELGEVDPFYNALLSAAKDCIEDVLRTAALQYEFMLYEDEKSIQKLMEQKKNLESTLNNLRVVVLSSEKDYMTNDFEGVAGDVKQYFSLWDRIYALWKNENAIIKGLNASGDTIQQISKEMIDLAKSDLAAKKKKVGFTIIVILVGSFIVILGVSAFLIRSITRPIQNVSSKMTDGANQVASGSKQISAASQSLAEGASEQAASIEETSSSLAEISSMTRQNAKNAHQVDTLMKDTNQVVGNANGSMKELTSSMEEISKASEETSKIIKTIDEIAFQTNLLALNAAVEAARAGEAGAGFAVVADEVRNLAMRAADAANNTADMIEGTVKKVKDGSDLVNTTSEAFSAVASSTAKVGDLVGEIAAVSSEQAQGIEQINGAVAEMDKVLQQNVAHAEESAAASEEMSAQSTKMKSMVSQLEALVGSRNIEVRKEPDKVEGQQKRVDRHRSTETSGTLGMKRNHSISETRGKANKLASHSTRGVTPQQVIPMDEDFEDF